MAAPTFRNVGTASGATDAGGAWSYTATMTIAAG